MASGSVFRRFAENKHAVARLIVPVCASIVSLIYIALTD